MFLSFIGPSFYVCNVASLFVGMALVDFVGWPGCKVASLFIGMALVEFVGWPGAQMWVLPSLANNSTLAAQPSPAQLS